MPKNFQATKTVGDVFMNLNERIEERELRREEIESKVSVYGISGAGLFFTKADKMLIQALVLLSRAVDDYLSHRLTTDKVVEGILRDIQANTAAIAEKK
jgi:hypothetical protein